MHLSGLNCTVSSKLKSVRKGQPIGFMYYFCPDSNREERTVIDSPVTGRVVEVNEEINRSLNWFYRFDNIDSSPEEFMDDETYRSFLMTLKA